MKYVDTDEVNKVFIDELEKIPSVLIDERIEWTAAREAILRCAKGVAAIPTADEEKIAIEYCMKNGLVMITIDSYETLMAYYDRINGLWKDT